MTLNLTINNAVVGDTTNTTVCDSLVSGMEAHIVLLGYTMIHHKPFQVARQYNYVKLDISPSETATISYGSLGNSTNTGLQAGDIAITAFSMDNPDEISFCMLLKELQHIRSFISLIMDGRVTTPLELMKVFIHGLHQLTMQ